MCRKKARILSFEGRRNGLIKKLKAKFIIINMLIAITISLAAFGVLYKSTYDRYYNDSIQAMKTAVSTSFDYDLPFDIGNKKNRNEIVAFYVTLTHDGRMDALIGNNVKITDKEKFEKLVLACCESNNKIGTIKTENLRYMVTNSRYYGKVVAFADISKEAEALASLCKTCVIIGSVIFTAFLVISFIFASWAINPVKKAIDNQNRFVADASHELKTPITAILANAEILSSTPEASIGEKQKQINYIKSEAESMSKLVYDMLTLAKNDFSRPKRSKLTVINLSEIVKTSALHFEAVIFEANKVLNCNIQDGLFIKGDEKELLRLCGVLLENAVKYTNDGGNIDIFLYEAAGRVNFTVRNSGEPIPKEKLPHIFDRFYRPDDARARQTGGFGLGLSIAKEIVQYHKGKISVESSDKIGTAFNMSFKKH